MSNEELASRFALLEFAVATLVHRAGITQTLIPLLEEIARDLAIKFAAPQEEQSLLRLLRQMPTPPR